MAGYANRLISLRFPELAEDDDEIWVTIRNPKLVPPGELRNTGVDSEIDTDTAEGATKGLEASYKVFGKLIVAWRVYDASSLGDEQPLLELPATPEQVAKLPMEILNRIGEELSKLNPK